MNRKQFKDKLDAIEKAYKLFLEDKGTEDFLASGLRFRFSTFISLVEDLHYGEYDEQSSSISMLESLDLERIEDCLLMPRNTLKFILHNPEKYAETIEYVTDEDEYDLFI